jgi:exonuclease III
MAGTTTYLSILTLNVNGFKSPIKRHHLAKWIKKEDPTIYYLQETHLIDRNKYFLRWKRGRRFNKLMPPRSSKKVHFKPKLVRKDKEGHFILIKRAIHQEEITIINLYAPNVGIPNFIKHTNILYTSIYTNGLKTTDGLPKQWRL